MVSSPDGVPFLTAGELNIYLFTKCQQFNGSFIDHCEKQSKFQEYLEAKSKLFTDLLLMKHIIRSREKRAMLFNWRMNLLKLLLVL
jgi:hypothetical protein